MGKNNGKLILGKTLLKVTLITKNNIYPSLIYLKGHPNNYLVTNDKYHTYHLLFIRG